MSCNNFVPDTDFCPEVNRVDFFAGHFGHSGHLAVSHRDAHMFVATLCCLGSKVVCGLNLRPDSDIELRSMDFFRARLGASLIRERLSVWRAAARGFQWYPSVMVMVMVE